MVVALTDIPLSVASALTWYVPKGSLRLSRSLYTAVPFDPVVKFCVNNVPPDLVMVSFTLALATDDPEELTAIVIKTACLRL